MAELTHSTCRNGVLCIAINLRCHPERSCSFAKRTSKESKDPLKLWARNGAAGNSSPAAGGQNAFRGPEVAQECKGSFDSSARFASESCGVAQDDRDLKI